MPLGLIPFLFLAVPLSEIAIFVMVGSQIGVLPTIGLVLLTAVTGTILLRVQGFAIVSRVRAELDAGRIPGRELASGVMILAAGLLLLTPGFLTDTIGLLLFVPPVRDAIWSFVAARIVVRSASFRAGMGGAGPFRRRQEDHTIDLDPEDFHTDRDPANRPDRSNDTPWRSLPRDPDR
ncbi:MAG: membrane protein FxsA [Rhizobiaceae bacterium]|nr:membrane protein FxsA [Rhizobiaceae bacterium]MCV0404672.1 membrane protein FxsA [Rhizobiaceae bacterium]